MIEIKVTGMTCGGCANSVKRAIAREFPDTDVEVDLETGIVRVNGDIDVARAEHSIKNAGFGVTSTTP